MATTTVEGRQPHGSPGAGPPIRETPRGRRLVRADNGMDVFGQGIRIMLFTSVFAAVAIALHLGAPGLVRLPLPRTALVALGVALLVPGAMLWAAGLVQLLVAFSRGKLVTSGAYAVCRNPIYASFGLFVLPGLSFLAGTWVYLAVAAALCLGVRIFIPAEERDLLRVFGDEYRRYTARVHRLLPFVRPARSAV